MPPRLLIVDDEAASADILCLLLEGAGYRVAVASDGRAALARLAQARADLVLSDVLLPFLDGLGLAAALRADPALRAIPLVLLSAAPAAAARAVPHATFLPNLFDLADVLTTIAGLIGPGHGRQ